jgi:hypothetical protein
MRWHWSLLVLVLVVSRSAAQVAPAPPAPSAPLFSPSELTDYASCLGGGQEAPDNSSGFLTGNHNFPNFINFISNPLMSIDPRAVTAIYPIFGNEWVKGPPALPDGDFQIYGPALTVALSDRFAIGLNQGGYAVAAFSHDQRTRLVNLLNKDPRFATLRPDLENRLLNLATGSSPDGFLNLGGFAQYTLIQDVPDQFLLTAGIRLEVPCGSNEVLQGYGPTEMAGYLTAGKEFGKFHVLATTGYEFPIAAGSDNTNCFYANLHLDRQCFGWLYPLVELNGIYQTRSVSLGVDTRRGFIDFDNFDSTGNVLSLATGVNAVFVKEKVEFGAVYTTTLATQGNFNANGLLLKMTLRY